MEEEKTVALCFWGLTRSLKYTLQSIEENIFSALKKNNVIYDIYLHTYTLSSFYVNKRAKEEGELDFNEYTLLSPNFVRIDNQDEVKKMLKLEEYRTFPDPWQTNYETADNSICASWSKFQLSSMIRESGKKYKNIIFLRPDVRFISPFNINYLSLCTDNIFFTPDFHQFGGLNDRFFLSTHKNGLIYGDAFLYLKMYSKVKDIHSEKYLLFYLCCINKLKNLPIKLYFNRVRMNGSELKDI
jgi:hypothetical protein